MVHGLYIFRMGKLEEFNARGQVEREVIPALSIVITPVPTGVSVSRLLPIITIVLLI